MRSAALLLILCLSGVGPARAGLTLDGSWQTQKEIDTGLPASGFGAGLSVDIGPYVFLGVGYSSVRTESFEDATDGVEGRLEYRSQSADLGVTWPWMDSLGVTLTGGYTMSSTRGLDGFANDRTAHFRGPTGSLALWWQPDSILSFNVSRGYSYIAGLPGWDTAGGVGLRLWGQTWLDAGYWRGEGLDGWTAGLRTTFSGN